MLEALESLHLNLSQKLGTRIYLLGLENIQFSLGVLEQLQDDLQLQQVVLSASLLRQLKSEPDQSRQLFLQDSLSDFAEVVLGPEGVLQILTTDESFIAHASPKKSNAPGLVPISTAQALPRLLGTTGQFIPKGSTFERNKLEMAAQRLLDSENVDVLIEDFRYLFRASLTLKQNPSSLLESALAREKIELSREVAAAIKEYLDSNLGSILVGVFSDQPQVQVNSIHQLSQLQPLPDGRILAAIGRSVWNTDNNREALLASAHNWTQALRHDLGAVDRLLDLFFSQIDELLPAQKSQLSDCLLAWYCQGSAPWNELWQRLQYRGQQAPWDYLGVNLRLFLIRLFYLAQGDAPEAADDLSMAQLWMREILGRWGDRPGILERAALVLQMMGNDFLAQLIHPHASDDFPEATQLRLFQAALEQPEMDPNSLMLHPLAQAVDEFCLHSLLTRNKTVSLYIAKGPSTTRKHWLQSRSFTQKLQAASSTIRNQVGDFLADLIQIVEAPEDEELFQVLARLEWTQVRSALARLEDHVHRQGRAAAWSLWFFAKLIAFRFEHDAAQTRTLCEMHFEASPAQLLARCLDFPLYRPGAHPLVWQALGYLGSWPDCSPVQGTRILGLLMDSIVRSPAPLGGDSATSPPTPQLLVQNKFSAPSLPLTQLEWQAVSEAMVRLHRFGPADTALEIEGFLAKKFELQPGLSSRDQGAPTLSQALEIYYQLAQHSPLQQAQQALSLLSRRLADPPVRSLQKALMQALREGDGGDMAISVRRSWDQEDLETAIAICGALARCQLALGRIQADDTQPVRPSEQALALRVAELAATRLLAVAEDWLHRLGSVKETYLSRSHAVWNQWSLLIEFGLTERSQQGCIQLLHHLLQCHEKMPGKLQLRERGEVLRTTFNWLVWALSHSTTAESALARSIIDLLGNLAKPQPEDQHPPVAYHFLEKLNQHDNFKDWPPSVQASLRSWHAIIPTPVGSN